MKCRICGGALQKRITDFPFKIADTGIVIIRALPVFQCRQCGETELENAEMVRVENLLSAVNSSAELEVISYAT